jgi:DNA polymerase-3 subunit delta'
MPFESVLGQPFATGILQSALSIGRTASAYLFYGPPGCGKKTAARALAQALLCSASPKQGCGACSACQRVMRDSHPDCRILGPAGNTFKVDQARELVRESHLRPFEGSERIYIIDRAETFNMESANTLLKTLEEPPQGTTFVLVTTQPARLLPTIHSRCQSVRFQPLPDEALTQLLCAAHACEAPAAREAGRLAGGDLKLAGRLLSPEGKDLMALAESFLQAAVSDSRVQRMAWAHAASQDKEDLKLVLDLCGVLLRELWVDHRKLDKGLRWLPKLPEHGKALHPDKARALLAGLAEARECLRANVNPALALEVLFIEEGVPASKA